MPPTVDLDRTLALILGDLDALAAQPLEQTKVTCESYVRDSRFEVTCLGYDLGEGRSGWVKAAEIPAFLARFDWSKTAVLCHSPSNEAAWPGYIS